MENTLVTLKALQTLNTLLLLGLSIIVLGCKETFTKPNVVIIVTDDQGWGDVGYNGNPVIKTPNIDLLAREGIVFNHFYVSAVCSPTRAEILTGRYAVRGGVYSTSEGGERLDLDEATIAEAFKSNGYATGAFGKWHNGMQYPYHPNGRGFDEFYGFCSGHWGSYFSPMLERNGQIVQGKGYLSDDLTNEAISFIEKNRDQPFFVYLPFNIPHSPMQVPDSTWNDFKSIELPSHRFDSLENADHTRAAYAMCENIDRNVGKIAKRLRELSLEENTIVIYLSDNGPNGWRWNGDMKGRKGHTDEGGVRSPAILKWSGTLESTVIDEITSGLDLFPTLINLANLDYSPVKPFDGMDLTPLLKDPGTDWQDRILVNHWGNQTSVRNQRFRLDKDEQLFDIENDPGQYEDVKESHPEVWRSMVDYKEKWKNSVLAELPEEDERNFVMSHPDYPYYQLPARDAIPYGSIIRSNRWPNCSFLTNWTSPNDSITWDIEVLKSGKFDVTLYYTCKPENVGARISLNFGSNKAINQISESHDPPLKGMEYDRISREESYVKDFRPWDLGTIKLDAGQGFLVLQADSIVGDEAIDFRLLMLERVD